MGGGVWPFLGLPLPVDAPSVRANPTLPQRLTAVVNMTKKDLALSENVLPYSNQLTPLIMTEQFSQDDTGQIAGAGVKGHRYKKIHRAYRLTLCKSPELPHPHHLKSKFDEAFGLGYGFKYRRT